MNNSFNTLCQIGQNKEALLGHISTPICQSTAFIFPDTTTGAKRAEDIKAHNFYGRWGNYNSREFEELIATLEKTDDAVSASSGLGIISMVLNTFLNPGDHIVASYECYSETKILIDFICKKLQLEVDFIGSENIQNYKKAIKRNTRIVYIETPANPRVSLVDIETLSEYVKETEKGLLIVDSTFASPFNQNPILLGADMVLHSATKYIGGHSDVIAGVVAGRQELVNQVRKTFSFSGPHLEAFSAWLLCRGIKTLGLRIDKQNSNALALSEWLNNHPSIELVRYPFHPSHPQYTLAKKQMRGGGGMICFYVKGGSQAALNLVSNTKLIKMTVSLGGVRSTITHPASMTQNLLTD
ncbi:MAG TPA: aminotransferase class I/II-fold pyridoxal phosphate-dependent enzyme, partial [Bacteroidia bacterium]|nr:aminotransferase class I/II-fold pyridoxal phosphate-dependent enzyme [Bacteroidia bacterium]